MVWGHAALKTLKKQASEIGLKCHFHREKADFNCMYVVCAIPLVPNMYSLVIYSLYLLKITNDIDKSTNLDLPLHFLISQIQENATNPAYNNP